MKLHYHSYDSAIAAARFAVARGTADRLMVVEAYDDPDQDIGELYLVDREGLIELAADTWLDERDTLTHEVIRAEAAQEVRAA